jgi:ActR/RegA family two-component response regulator
MNPSRAHRLISICDDDSLRYSREMVLRHAGYETVSVTSHASLEELTSEPFDIAIVCPSIVADRAFRIVQRLRDRNPDIRVLRIQSYPSEPNYSFGPEYTVPGRPTALLRAVAALRGEVRRIA